VVFLQCHIFIVRIHFYYVLIHRRDKLRTLLENMEKAGIIAQMGNEKGDEMGTQFINPIIIITKGDTHKLVLDARYLNSITDLSSYHWPLESIDTLLTRIKGEYFTSSDMAFAYHQVPLIKETAKLCSFVVDDKQWTYNHGFYELSGLPHFFSKLMTLLFVSMIKNVQQLHI